MRVTVGILITFVMSVLFYRPSMAEVMRGGEEHAFLIKVINQLSTHLGPENQEQRAELANFKIEVLKGDQQNIDFISAIKTLVGDEAHDQIWRGAVSE